MVAKSPESHTTVVPVALSCSNELVIVMISGREIDLVSLAIQDYEVMFLRSIIDYQGKKILVEWRRMG